MPYVPTTLGLLLSGSAAILWQNSHGDKKEGYRPTIPRSREKFNANL